MLKHPLIHFTERKNTMSKIRLNQERNKTIADEMFEHANIINNASRTANLYGKLFALQEMQIYVLSEIKKVKDQIEEN
tara:strand:- start:111 stop:344 length:234 start_codon:yes stop_codon:yes gene_type:complete